MASPCGASAALEEAKAGIDNLKAKLQGGLDSVGDIGALADTIKAKLAEVNTPKVPSVSLQDELAKLSTLSPDEYTKKVAELKAQFGSGVPDLQKYIDAIPKPAGLNAAGDKNMFADLQQMIGNVGAAFQNAQDIINNASLENITSDVCKNVPNVEVVVITDANGNTTTSEPVEKPAPPVTPAKNPVKEEPPSTPPSDKFTFAFTKDKLVAAAGKSAGPWYDAMNQVLPKYGITTPERVAAFLGNCRTETNWTTLVESLKYKAEYLFNNMNPGRKRFATLEDAKAVEYKEESIANIVYMVGRKLLDPQPGDGYKFRGRGLMQLTFKENYLRASKGIYGDDRLVKDPDSVANDKTVAIETACYYFKTKNVNAWADKQDWGNCRSIVNAGSPGKDPSKIHGYDTGVKYQTTAYNALKA